MKNEPTYYERMEKNYIEQECSKACKRFIGISISTIVLFLSALTLMTCCSCSNDNEPTKENKNLYYVSRHDAIPEQFKGYWCSVNDKTTEVLNVTDEFVMTKDFTINRKEDNIVRVNDSILHLYQNGKFFALAFGSNEVLTITAFNDCYDTVIPFIPSLPEPQEPVNNVN